MQDLLRPMQALHVQLQDQHTEDLRNVKILHEKMNANIRNAEDRTREVAHNTELFQTQTMQQLTAQAQQAQATQQSMQDVLLLLKAQMEGRVQPSNSQQ